MARMKHPKGDLQMAINGVEVIGDAMVVNGKMGVWSAQIFFEPEDLAALTKHMLNRRLIGYMLKLPFTLRSRKRRAQAAEQKPGG